MDSQAIRKEAERLLELLRSEAAQERLQAAARLKSLGVRSRGAVRACGLSTKSAAKPIEELDLTPAIESLANAQWEVRREVALASGEWVKQLIVGS